MTKAAPDSSCLFLVSQKYPIYISQSGQGLVQAAHCTSALTGSCFGNDIGGCVDVLRGCCSQSSGQGGSLGGAWRRRASCAARVVSVIFNTMHASRRACPLISSQAGKMTF